jgi:hypothetical protein
LNPGDHMNMKQECLYFRSWRSVISIKIVFWVVTPCGLAGAYQRFGGTYCLHLQPFEASNNLLKLLGNFLKMMLTYCRKQVHILPNNLL